MTTKIYSIEEIKTLLAEVLEETDVKQAILFGSYAKNTPNNTSDVDILIDSDGKIKGLEFYALIDLIRETLNKDVDVIEKTEINEGSRIDEEIKKTGVVVYER